MSVNNENKTNIISTLHKDEPPCLVEPIPELTSLSSISGTTPPQTTSNSSVIPIQCNEVFKQMSSDVIAEREQNKQSIQDFVKDQLFKRLKFYNSELLLYNTKKNSVCQKVCNHLNMAEAGRISFWKIYSSCVEGAIRVAWIDVVQAMKATFLGGKSIKPKTQFESTHFLTYCLFFRFCQSL